MNWVTVVALRSFQSQGIKVNERRMAFYDEKMGGWWIKISDFEYPRILALNYEIRVISPLELLAEAAE